jgi:hypothetical protein
MIDWFASFFPSWVPDQWIYCLAGVWVAGVLLVIFPPWRKSK